jgi:predicted 3-demethylubiquinone-9 3-methyltransferase (glyoxalase superfamily)
MPSITPHLWFDKEAKEAANFYTAIFPNSKITYSSTLHGTPSGDCDILSFEIGGHPFMAISAGMMFKINSSISFIVNFHPANDKNARENLDGIWEKLADGGNVKMPIGEYPFSKRYGWVEDKFGVSWQLFLTDPDGAKRPFIIPFLMFVGDVCGKAEE